MSGPAIGSARIDAIDRPPPANSLHLAIFLDNRDVVGDETFRLISLSGTEEVSEPFEFHLELRANDAARGRTLRLGELVGKPITFAVALPAPADAGRTWIEDSTARFRAALDGGATDGLALWNGIVATFAMGAPGVYQVTVRPSLWRLTLANRYVIYDDQTVEGAITEVLGHHRIVPDTAAVGGLAVARKQDWLQAGESDYEFLRRMMGKAHIYFYFRHGARDHEIVFANRPEYPEALPGRTLRYTFTDASEGALSQFDVVGDYRYEQSLAITGVHTVFTRQDEAWQTDGVPRIHQFDVPPPPEQSGPQVFQQHKVYQYGSGSEEAQAFNQATAEAIRTTASQLSGESYCAALRTGFRFTMTETAGETPGPVRPTLDGLPFVVTKLSHEASADGTYKNKFEATEADGLLAAFSLADTQQGTVLATVVAHAGGRTPASWKYYEKRDFDPQTQPYTDGEGGLQAQGVYVRLATDPDGARRWVKLAAHMQTAPEIGAQVIVSRANDESELPEVQQIVAAAGTYVVTPSTWTASTHVGSGYSTRYGDGINVGFGARSVADLGRAVGIGTAAYQTGKFREASYSQGASYGFSAAESLARTARQDLGATFGPHGPADDVLSMNESFGSSFSRSVGEVQSSVAEHEVSYSKSDFGMSESFTTVRGTALSEATHLGQVTNKTTILAASESLTKQVGNSYDERTQTGVATNVATHLGSTASTTTVTGVASNTSTIATQKNTSVIGTSHSDDQIGASVQTSAIGSQVSNSTVGVANHMSATGAINNMSATGAQSTMQVTGAGSTIAVSGAENRMNAYGFLSDFNFIATGIRYHGEWLVADLNQKASQITLLVSIKIIL